MSLYGCMEKKCVICGEKFETKYSNQITCSLECGKGRRKKKQDKKEKDKKLIIFERDNFTCVYCGKNVVEDNIKLEVDHLIPKTEGGSNANNNKVTSCRDCNREKSGKKLSDKFIFLIKTKISGSKLKGGQNGEAL